MSFSYDNKYRVFKGYQCVGRGRENIGAWWARPAAGESDVLFPAAPFYDVTHGSVMIDRQDVRDVTLKSLRITIGIVQQDVYMFGGTIRDNIAYSKPKATDAQVVEAAKVRHIHEFIMSLEEGYETNVGERGMLTVRRGKNNALRLRVFS